MAHSWLLPDVNEWLNETLGAQLTSKRAILFTLLSDPRFSIFLEKLVFPLSVNAVLSSLHLCNLAGLPPSPPAAPPPPCRWMKDPAFD